jgi:hypothetical protein
MISRRTSGQCSHLSLTHQTGSAIASLDRGSIGHLIPKLGERLINTLLAAVSVADLKGCQSFSLAMLDNLYLSRTVRIR